MSRRYRTVGAVRVLAVTLLTLLGGAMAVAAGRAGTLAWRSSGAGAQRLVSVAWDGARFVAEAREGSAFASPDGLNWEPCAAVSGPARGTVAWSGSRMVVAGGEKASRQPALLPWQAAHLERVAGEPIRAVCAREAKGHRLFVAVGDQGTVLMSRDGRKWTAATWASDDLHGVAWGGTQGEERFVAVGQGGTILTSADGKQWTPAAGQGSDDLNAVAWCGSRFIAVGAAGTIVSSEDGLTWRAEPSPVSQWLYAVSWNGLRAVAVGDYGAVAVAAAVPAVSAVSPNAGPLAGGTTVIVTGTAFTGATEVDFGAGNAATHVTINSDTQISCTSPAGSAGTVDVTVTTPNGTSATSSADKFTYAAAPTVTGIAPAAGLTTGGTLVTVTGANFISGAGGTTVKFGTLAATAVAVASNGLSLTAVSPSQSAGLVDITVTTAGGTSATSAADRFTYVAPLPVVLSLSPGSGPLAGGTTVTVSGVGFTGATKVLFGAVAGTKVSVTNDTSLTVVSPAAKTPGVVDVTVTTAGGASPVWEGDAFTYQTPAPTVTSLSPSSGPVAGGTVVTVTGTNFAAGATVSFGTAAAASVTVVSATQIKATSPPGTGSVHVTVTTSNGTSVTSAADLFTYVAAPTVTGINPRFGSIAGGTSVVITGTGFQAGAAVAIGGVPATNVTVANATTLSAVTAAHASPGAVDVVVTNPDGQAGTLTGGFTYALPPTITAVAKLPDPFRLKITGSNFSLNCSVSINGQLVPEASWKNSAKIIVKGGAVLKALLPKGVPVQITVTNNDTLITSQPFTFQR